MTDYIRSGLLSASSGLYAEYIDDNSERVAEALLKQASAETGAAVGGALFGPLGAAIGSLAGKEKDDKYKASPTWRAVGGAMLGGIPGAAAGLVARGPQRRALVKAMSLALRGNNRAAERALANVPRLTKGQRAAVLASHVARKGGHGYGAYVGAKSAKKKEANAILGSMLGGLAGAGHRAFKLHKLTRGGAAVDDIAAQAAKIRKATEAAKAEGKMPILSAKESTVLRNAKFLENKKKMEAAGKWRKPGEGASGIAKGIDAAKNIGQAGMADIARSGLSGAITGGVLGKGATLAQKHIAKKKIINTAKNVGVPAALGLGAGLAIS